MSGSKFNFNIQNVENLYHVSGAQAQEGNPNPVAPTKPVTKSQDAPTQDQIIKIADKITSARKMIARRLGLGATDLENIEADHQDARERNIQVLQKWQELKGKEATKAALAKALVDEGRGDLADLLAC